jgi:hypothetical protein
MGILDDAIRDHLDLKRRRGADPSEVERAERDALGPVRRNPAPGELAEADVEAAPGGAPAFAPEAGPAYAPEAGPAYAPEVGPAYAPEAGPAYDHAGDEDWSHDSLPEPAADTGVQPVYNEPPAEPFDEEPPHEPFPAPPVAPPSAAPPAMAGAGPETAEYDVEDALAAEERREQTADGEDVLEETPEFLQDTPDHDRLWFEQRPPKDFDFDE